MLPQANRVRRERMSAAHLTAGLQCGGSDAFSSLSANPALGVAAWATSCGITLPPAQA
ncbi:hypothetical protein [Hydrogenophaga sp.]|uniref:hypothetical protein n=1 Tax=Hydrogenophaga sp. TaxID=1904254 RepID=UPI003F717EF7